MKDMRRRMPNWRMKQMHQPDDPQPWPEDIELECGSIASFDMDSGISYRCTTCFAVVGSIGMPDRCRELEDMVVVIEKLRGRK
jgi:hypothetical protein